MRVQFSSETLVSMIAPHFIPSEFSNAVIDALRDVMNYDRISCEQLAHLTGHHPNYLTKVFANRISPTLQDVNDIALALNLDPSEVCGEVMW